jgi:hypothetical protein
MRYDVKPLGIQWALVEVRTGRVLGTFFAETTARWICGLANAAVA